MENSTVTKQDIATIREWISKEIYLPQDINDLMLWKFLNSCNRSLEATKQCIERFALGRANMKEIYTNRDPLSEPIITAFSITSVVTFEADKHELLIHQLDDPNLDKFSFYDLLKAFTVQADYWLKFHEYKEFPEGHIIVLDIKDYHLRIIPKVNIMYFRDFLLFLLESMPVRVKQVHVVNCPSFYEKLFALVKPILPAEILEIIQFHGDAVGISKFIDKKYLPKEYGGEQSTLKDEQKGWVAKVNAKRSMFLNNNLWTADLKKKPKSSADKTMNGSFRTLSID
ncbi:alpha-tocopherol transfer protein-like [Plodia interpunctella]|uniref:alpha-tocopherol transfer protein-like n=1 Tax=Plodia interpunctella TaxID=58824 RepID=UPI002367B263|nr:alpha-tocopherol transfer protein-like [Plodia interpunctella]